MLALVKYVNIPMLLFCFASLKSVRFHQEALYRTYGMEPGEVDVLLVVALVFIVVLGWFFCGCYIQYITFIYHHSNYITCKEQAYNWRSLP